MLIGPFNASFAAWINRLSVEAVDPSCEWVEDEQTVDYVKILRIPGDQRETKFEGCSRNQRVW